MRLHEIAPDDPTDRRVKQMKANAKAAAEKAKQLKLQADATAERLDFQKSMQDLSKLRRQAGTQPI